MRGRTCGASSLQRCCGARPCHRSIRHVYLNPDRRKDALDEDAQAVRATLRSSLGAANAGELGDAFLGAQVFETLDQVAVARFLDRVKASIPSMRVRFRRPAEL